MKQWEGWLPHCKVAVDHWSLHKCPHATTIERPYLMSFFLTHFHSDHRQGLDEKWRHGTVYLTETTAALVLRTFPTFPRNLLHILTPNEAYTFPIYVTESEYLTVTPIPVTHMPGAVMFLFEGPGAGGRFLHTGDFRLTPCIMSHPLLKPDSIDTIVLDCGFLDAQASCDFPTQEEAIEQGIALVKQHPQHAVILVCDMMGQESFVLGVARAYHALVVLEEGMYDEWCTAGVDSRLLLSLGSEPTPTQHTQRLFYCAPLQRHGVLNMRRVIAKASPHCAGTLVLNPSVIGSSPTNWQQYRDRPKREEHRDNWVRLLMPMMTHETS